MTKMIFSKDSKEFLNIAIKAATRAGDFILRHFGSISSGDINQKQPSDFVTFVDKESEKIIIETIRTAYPDHYFLTEESIKEECSEGYLWIIDPLDGTTNYIHGFPVFSVSIALQNKKETIVGVVFDPLRSELFTSEAGKGAFLNERSLTVTSTHNTMNALLSTGFPFRCRELIDPYLQLFKNLFYQVSGIRRPGSAALDLAYVAAGRCDGFFEIGLNSWDMAAGALLIKEAGGITTDFGGGDQFLSTGNILAGSKTVHKMLLEETKKIFTGIITK